jgi:hypothetical protein
MNFTNKIYPWKIKEGACQYMAGILSYPEQVDYRMDGQICRITVTTYTIAGNIKPHYHKDLSQDHLWQVQVLGIEDREFLVVQSQLISLGGDVVVVDRNGNLLP